MKQKIYLARHGATDSNREQRNMGSRVDEPLNEDGRRDAYILAKSVPTDVEVIISSPLKRARETADIVAVALRLPVIECEELKERDSGDLSGKLWSHIATLTNGTLTLETLRSNFEVDYSPWGGEGPEQVRKRVDAFFARVRDEWRGKTVLAVTHAGIIRVCLMRAGYETPPPIRNGGLYEIEI